MYLNNVLYNENEKTVMNKTKIDQEKGEKTMENF